MAYNKKERLRASIDAIRTVFMLEKEGRKSTPMEAGIILKQYAGFGGLKCVLNPASSLADTAYWAKSELELFPLVADLHRVLMVSSKGYRTRQLVPGKNNRRT